MVKHLTDETQTTVEAARAMPGQGDFLTTWGVQADQDTALGGSNLTPFNNSLSPGSQWLDDDAQARFLTFAFESTLVLLLLLLFPKVFFLTTWKSSE